jgi:hypothetical protein
MNPIIAWLSKNKVLLFGLASAIAINVQQYFTTNEILNWPAILLSSGIVITSFLAKNLRGQWITILGSVGSFFTVLLNSIDSNTPIVWRTAILTLVVSILAAVAPAGKSLSYEQSGPVETAKAEAKAIDAAKKPPVNPPVQTETPKTP